MLLKVSLLNFFPLDTYFSVIFLQNCYCEIPSFYTEEQSNHFKKIICYSRKKKSFIFVHSATEVLKSSPCTFVRTDLSHSCSKDQDEIVKQTSPVFKKGPPYLDNISKILQRRFSLASAAFSFASLSSFSYLSDFILLISGIA